MTVTPVYAGILALLFVGLSMRVIALRRGARVGLGDGGNRLLMRRMRVQANFAEYVPLCLLLMAFAELQGAPAWVLHGIGTVLLAGRLIHSTGVSREPEPTGFRTVGMVMTFVSLNCAAIVVLVLAIGVLGSPPL